MVYIPHPGFLGSSVQICTLSELLGKPEASVTRKIVTLSSLLQEETATAGEPNDHCPYAGCGKSFTKSWLRARHVLVHTRERPYLCGHCRETFQYSERLRRHVIGHILADKRDAGSKQVKVTRYVGRYTGDAADLVEYQRKER